jgi:pimeloyl-ACP methyl ester carboxylesterase
MDRHTSFARVRSRLMESCHVISYDRRGYAQSRDVVPPALGIDDHVADLESVVAGRRAVLVGHSYGGTVVLCFAARHPELTAIAFVYEPGLGWRESWPGESSANPFAGVTAEQAAEGFMKRLIGPQRWERLPPKTRSEVLRDGDAMVTELTAVRRDPPPFDPATIEVPVMVARGEKATANHKEGADWLVGELPQGSLHVVDGAGHNGHQSHPSQFAGLVLEAVRRCELDLSNR